MPVLAAYVGTRSITFLIVYSAKNYEIFHFPFVYTSDLYGHFVDEGTFYTRLFNFVKRKFKLPEKTCVTLVCGHLNPISLDNSPKINVSSAAVLSLVSEYTLRFVGGLDLQPVFTPDLGDAAEFLSNLSVFPQMVATDQKDKVAFDNLSLLSLKNKDTIPEDNLAKPLLFSGDSLLPTYADKCATHLFVLDALQDVGLYTVYLDYLNIFLPLSLLKMYDTNLYRQLADDMAFTPLGTVLHVVGNVECLFQADAGTSQFFEVSPDQLFFVPLEPDTTATISFKSNDLSQDTVTIRGGSLGFVVDTRVRSVQDLVTSPTNVLKLEVWEKQIATALGEL